MWKKKLALWATLSRIVLAFIIFGLMFIEFKGSLIVSGVLLTIASLTDWLDGMWARKYDSVSNFGRFMDPVADKILVIAVLLVFLVQGLVPAFMVLVLICRDILIGGIRAAAASENLIISAGKTGKLKTALQMIAMIIIFLRGFHEFFLTAGVWLLWATVVLSLWSAYEYVVSYLKNAKTIGTAA